MNVDVRIGVELCWMESWCNHFCHLINERGIVLSQITCSLMYQVMNEMRCVGSYLHDCDKPTKRSSPYEITIHTHKPTTLLKYFIIFNER